MRYQSTRGGVQDVEFKDVLLSGYANDGGMFLPMSTPTVSSATLQKWSALSFEDLAYEVTSLYIEEKDIPSTDLKDIYHKAFSTFKVPDVVPIKKLSDRLTIAELFHGRSLAFKDLAMSCLGQFYNYFLTKSQEHLTLVVCTSGDTGSSAIESVRGLHLVDIIVILPRGRCTLIQERQMTTVLDNNVHVFRADGSSDDIDLIVRKLFADSEFVRMQHLASSSSLNFVRILIQMVHFFYIYLKMCPSADEEVEMVLPTGGGGNVTAGIIAKQMGLPVKLVCAVNHNNILSRIMKSGHCLLGDVQVTIAPAMDIQFAYNLERVWYLISGGSSETVKTIMADVDRNIVNVPSDIIALMNSLIKVYVVSNDEEVKDTIRRCWNDNDYFICPHTAIGVSYIYAELNSSSNKQKSVVLATASPLKFPDAIKASGLSPPTSEAIEDLLTAPTKYTDLDLGLDWTSIVRRKIEEITLSRKI
ncbi:threonine synthase 2 [Biomphalaria glabrata]|nr:threonine synthase 2 [Biomphalaria glabrata]